MSEFVRGMNTAWMIDEAGRASAAGMDLAIRAGRPRYDDVHPTDAAQVQELLHLLQAAQAEAARTRAECEQLRALAQSNHDAYKREMDERCRLQVEINALQLALDWATPDAESNSFAAE